MFDLKCDTNLILALIFLIFISCNNQKTNSLVIQDSSNQACGCDSLWTNTKTKEFVDVIKASTKSDYTIWHDYNIQDGYYVLNAGSLNDSAHCMGIFNKGLAVSYKCIRDKPKMLTALYSYYLNYENGNNENSVLLATCNEAPAFKHWMQENNVEAAVYMPTQFPKFPYKISGLKKAQLAIHEVFHIEVTLRHWFSNKGFWPDWDEQPNRAGLQICYTNSDSVKALIQMEQTNLVATIEALLDNEIDTAKSYAEHFVEARERRYNLLKDTQITLANDSLGDCRVGEAIMEIEEGIADYASWVAMFNIGTISREDLLKRFKVQQKDKFYLFGCMLLHAATLMNDGNDKALISQMVNAPSVEEGNLYKLFKEQLDTLP